MHVTRLAYACTSESRRPPPPDRLVDPEVEDDERGEWDDAGDEEARDVAVVEHVVLVHTKRCGDDAERLNSVSRLHVRGCFTSKGLFLTL